MGQPVIIQSYPVPTKNQIQLQFASIQLALRGTKFRYFTEIEYTDSTEPGEARGASPYPMGTTIGEYKANGSITIHLRQRETFFNIIDPNNTGYQAQFFPLTCQYQEYGWDEVYTDDLPACRITGLGHTFSAGNGVLMSKHPMYITLIKPNGRLPLPGIPV
jgi:hypothetical protein